jgi:hypothetical protein
MDIADLSTIWGYNDKYKYLLNNIDILAVCLEHSVKGQDG